MKFGNRIKKEMSEGLIRAVLTDAGYRVVSSGVESLVREVECLSSREYNALGFSNGLRKLPDFIVMNRDQSEMHAVEVKYRKDWSPRLLEDIKGQVQLVGRITLICFNATPMFSSEPSAATYLRCCELKYENGHYLVNFYKDRAFSWREVSAVYEDPEPWFRLAPMQRVFDELEDRWSDKTLENAVLAMESVFKNF